jgi:hypothetical protein
MKNRTLFVLKNNMLVHILIITTLISIFITRSDNWKVYIPITILYILYEASKQKEIK